MFISRDAIGTVLLPGLIVLYGNGSFRIPQEILYHPPIFLMEIPGSLWEAREQF